MAKSLDTRAELTEAVQSIVSFIERPREADIVTRRYGIKGEQETLEQVGETMHITRERVRQIEKATMIRIKLWLEKGSCQAFNVAEMDIVKSLHEMGRAAKVGDLAEAVMGDSERQSRAYVMFLAELSGKMLPTTENDKYHAGVVLTSDKDDRSVKARIDEIIKVLKDKKEPATLDELFKLIGSGYEHPKEIGAIARLSKQVANLDDKWGLAKWASVNPRTIRDKVYIVLKDSRKPMHYSEIAQLIRDRGLNRNNSTDPAIHNELIKDDRFVLVGRGIYALAEYGYKKGSITDVITEVLRQHGPMYRDDIVREVLKARQVRETTILLNLQSRPQFKRVDKNKYALAEEVETSPTKS